MKSTSCLGFCMLQTVASVLICVQNRSEMSCGHVFSLSTFGFLVVLSERSIDVNKTLVFQRLPAYNFFDS